jgi:glutathione-regulated potassium-efflux system ancillary protein KefC
MAAEQSLLEGAAIYLAAAVVAVPIFKKLGLGAVLGYLVAGMVIGPYGMKLISDVDATLHFSEFGVVLLMFLIGLELNPAKLWQLRKLIFGIGTAQVMVSALLLALIGNLLGMPPFVALLGGVALAMSSTPIALQTLGERGQTDSMVGRLSFSTLLFQDIAVIPVLALVPLLGMAPESGDGGWIGAVRIIGVFFLFVVGGRYLLRPIFRVIAATKLREVFTAFSLLLVVGSGLLMQQVGISMALGTFFAGVLLAESEYRHELELNIEPFKGLLLGLFFIAVGMSVNLALLLETPLAVLAAIVILLMVKGGVLYGLGGLAGLMKSDRLLLALLLAQGGEFAFVLLALVQSEGLIAGNVASFLVVVATFSMLATPLLLFLYDRFLLPKLTQVDDRESDIVGNENHVIIAGYGRFGQIIGRLLMSLGMPITVVDHDPNQIEMLRKFGFKVFYGDATRLDLLESAGVAKARLLILAIDNMQPMLSTAEMVAEKYPNLPMLARARNRGDVNKLLDAGVKHVRRETFASSLEVGELALAELGFGAHQAHKTVQRFRGYDEKMLLESAKYRDDEKKLIDYAIRSRAQLEELMQADMEELSNIDKGW